MKDDTRLIDECLAGNAASFEELVRRHQDRLYNAMVHVAGSSEDAREVVQEAFLLSYLKLSSFQRQSAFFTWLYRIAHNIAISQRRKRRPVLSTDHRQESLGIEPVDPAAGPEERLERSERASQVHDAINQLGEEFKTVIILREIEGFDYETIGEMLEIPPGTVRSRLHRGRAMLREHLKGVVQEEHEVAIENLTSPAGRGRPKAG